MTYNPLIFGRNALERIVSCEVQDDLIEIFFEDENGKIRSEFKPNRYWTLAPIKVDNDFKELDGKLYYRYLKTYTDRRSYSQDTFKYKNRDLYNVWDEKEAAMILLGFTYYKGMKLDDVSVLSFDIESTSLEHGDKSKVLMISNTFRSKGVTTRKMFSYDDYDTDAGMFDAWCEWVREVNPSIVIGHNIFLYDLPYMDFCARKAGTELNLGRDSSSLRFGAKESKFRKDGSQFYTYKRAFIYGREIVDTMFLAYKYDIGRKYENYRLKSIIKAENLEVKDRQFYDADQIRFTYKDPVEWEKIKKYAEHDADDALALYDLMIPSYFYFTQSMPKTFQNIMYTASGSQINSFLVRSYIQAGHSIPKTTEGQTFEGGISMGNPGVYKNVYKVDVASLYPSIMLQYQVYDKYKDPMMNFVNMVDYFTTERLNNKRLGKETGDRHYKDLEQAQKIVINSAYGMMGAPGLNFNSPANASFVTRKGREILQASIDWATNNGFQIVNADTDSISFTRNGEHLTEEERAAILKEINSLFPEKIVFEDDGYFKTVIVTKAKNYVLDDGKKVKIKGSALKASMKEKALKEFSDKVINYLLNDKAADLINLYHEYINEIHNVKDISRWCSKKTITAAVLNPERLNEQKVLDAMGDEELQEGDKIYVYYTNDRNLKLQAQWSNDHDITGLMEKLYKTLVVFNKVIDIEQFTKYHLKSHAVKVKLAETLGLPVPEKIKAPRKPRKKKETSVSNEVHQTEGDVGLWADSSY